MEFFKSVFFFEIWHGFCRIRCEQSFIHICYLGSDSVTYAASVSDVPEAQVTTPAEQGYSLEKASMTDQESASWQQKRVERKRQGKHSHQASQ
jgi:hypothetical protein